LARMMTVDDVREKLRKAVEAAGNEAAWARTHGVSRANVNMTLNGKREPGGRILEALGLERVVQYRVKRR